MPLLPALASLSVIDWLHVARLYVPYILTTSLVFAVSCLLPSRDELVSQYASNPRAAQAYALAFLAQAYAHVAGVWYAYAIIVACVVYLVTSKPPVYLVDFSLFEPPADWQVSRADLAEIFRRIGGYEPASVDFMQRLLERSGTGDATHWPPGTVKVLHEVTPAAFAPQREWVAPRRDAAADGAGKAGASAGAGSGAGGVASAASSSHSSSSKNDKGVASSTAAPPAAASAPTPSQPPDAQPDASMRAARLVAEQVLCSTFEDLLVRTGSQPRDIDFLIVNCSLFSPTPSLASIVARRFGLRPDVRTYSLGGMGCSASLISVDLAQQLLQNRRNSLAVVLSTEEITQQLYRGNRKDMLLQNTLFRVGGAAVLLSNKLADGFRAKYKLLHSVRFQDASDEAQDAITQCQDDDGRRGVSLSKGLVTIAGRALTNNLTVLGPQILPIREQIKVVWSIVRRAATPHLNRLAVRVGLASAPSKTGSDPSASAPPFFEKPPVYVPDFKKAVAHFCIHAGGRGVIDGIEANLHLEPHHTAPSRATLFHWGNTSSSSIWYELRYVEGENDRRDVGGASAKAAAGEGADSQQWDPARKWALPEYRGRHIRRGERVLQIAFGSGFKCNSAVWLRMK